MADADGPSPPAPAPVTPARAAWRNGQQALEAGDLATAARWLGRAGRLAPDDAAITLARAVLRLREGRPSDAADLLEPLLERHDVREGWMALAAAHAELNRPDDAAAALGRLLQGHALPQGDAFALLATRIADRAGWPGWCGITSDGRLAIRRFGRGGSVVLSIDGQPQRSTAALPATSRVASVQLDGRDLLGSPIRLTRIHRVEGVVKESAGGLDGWAWHPANPDRDAILTISGADGKKRFMVVADDTAMEAEHALARPRRFRVPAARLAPLRPPFRICGPDGRALAGSPIDAGASLRNAAAIAAALAVLHPLEGRPRPVAAGLARAPMPDGPRGPSPKARSAPQRRVAVVIPAYANAGMTQDCIARVLTTAPKGTHVVVVDDATPEPELAAMLDGLAKAKHIHLLRNSENLGFTASANAGMRLAASLPGAPDILLLNSDTRVTPGWLETLRTAVHASADIGTACPLSNDATILSYPRTDKPNPPPDPASLARLTRQIADANRTEVVDVPTGVGFCMYIRRECLAATGVFRADVFAQGYGEENDFCRRAHHLGWRHVAVTGAYVAHLSGASFAAATAPLLSRNLALLEELHPGYGAAIARFEAADPLAPARRRIDALRWRAARKRGGLSTILITHNQGGGTARVVAERAKALRAEGMRPIVIRPAGEPGSAHVSLGRIIVEEGDAPGSHPALTFFLPDELPDLLRLLKGDRAGLVEVHHMLGHHPSVLDIAARLGAELAFHVHDYAAFCPRISLLGPDRRYCGEPEQAAVCEACVADAGSASHEEIGIAALRARSARFFGMAQRISTPSADAAARLRRHFPQVWPEVRRPDDVDTHLPPLNPAPQAARRRVAVVGAIGPEKGYDVLLACARDAALRDLPLEFVVIGHTVDDDRLLDTARAFVTGRYAEADAVALVREQGAQIGFIPSIWPETWCFALSTAWRAGLAVACFDIGAQAERLRATKRGWLLPLGLPTVAINNALLSVSPRLADV